MRKVNRTITLSIAAAALALTAVPAFAASSGEALFSQHCAMCHGANGKGAVPGAPDFTKSDVLKQSDSVLSHRVLNGYHSAGSPMAMPPMKGQVSAAQVDEILAYMRKAFGG